MKWRIIRLIFFLFTLFFQVPIQVNKDLALRDGMKIAEPTKLAVKTVPSHAALFTELDR